MSTQTTEPAQHQWHPPLTSAMTERGPLPKHLNLPYLDEMRLVADAEKIAVKQVAGLAREMKLMKLTGTGLIWLSCLTFVIGYIFIALAEHSFISGFTALKIAWPFILISFLIRQTSIFIEKKYVKKPTFAPVVFNRQTHTLTIIHGWKRQKLEVSFDQVHAYIRYLSTPTGLTRPKLMLKMFDANAPHNVVMNYFLDLGPAEMEYQIAAQWCVICQFMDTTRDYPYNPQFWDAALMHHYPEEFRNYHSKGKKPSEESQDYYGVRLMDYALDQNAMGMIGVEEEAGLHGVFSEDNPYRRDFSELDNRRAEINTDIAELENQFGIGFPIPPAGLWCQEPVNS